MGGTEKSRCSYLRWLELEQLHICNQPGLGISISELLINLAYPDGQLKMRAFCLFPICRVESDHFELWRWSQRLELWGPASMPGPRAWTWEWRRRGRRREWLIAFAISKLPILTSPSSVSSARRTRHLLLPVMDGRTNVNSRLTISETSLHVTQKNKSFTEKLDPDIARNMCDNESPERNVLPENRGERTQFSAFLLQGIRTTVLEDGTPTVLVSVMIIREP